MPEVRWLRTMVNGVPVVAAPAGIDVTSAEQLRVVLLEASGRRRSTVVVDLTGTLFCDSCGIHTLLRAHKRAVAEGGELRLIIPAEGAARRVINLTRLDRLIPCFSSVAEATGLTAAPESSSAGSQPIRPEEITGATKR